MKERTGGKKKRPLGPQLVQKLERNGETKKKEKDALTERKTKGTKKQMKKKNEKKLRGVVPPPEMWQAQQNCSISARNRVRPRAKGKDRKTEAQQKHLKSSRSSLWYRGSIVDGEVLPK